MPFFYEKYSPSPSLKAKTFFAAVNAFTFTTIFFGFYQQDKYPEIMDKSASYLFYVSGACLSTIGVLSFMEWWYKPSLKKAETTWPNKLANHVIPVVAAVAADAGIALSELRSKADMEVGPEMLPAYIFVGAVVAPIIIADFIKIANFSVQPVKFTALAVVGAIAHIAAELGLAQSMIDTSLPSWCTLAGIIGMGTYGFALSTYLVGSSSWFKRACCPSWQAEENEESERLLSVQKHTSGLLAGDI